MNFDGICGRHLQIMVRTKGLGCALGKVISRALGRKDRHDSNDAPQRRRPIASACRQRESAAVVEDDHVVPAYEPVVGTYESVVDANVHALGADEPEGFPGGLRDPSVLMEYADHVAVNVWSREEHPELKLSSHGRKVQKLGRSAPKIEGLVAGTGLSSLIVFSVDTGDRRLISSFVERWHRETSSFHLPVGEVSITLYDVVSLLHLPIVGVFHTFQPLHVNEAVLMLVELLEVLGEEARVETAHCHGPYIRLSWLRDIYQSRCQAGHWTVAAHAYLLHLLGCTLFANKSATHVHLVFLDALCDLRATALVHMYDHLNDACISNSRQLAGYITLLQCWIYEHFLSVAECIANPNYDEVSPRACRWIATKPTVKTISIAMYRQRLDRLRIPDVCWMPYGEHRLVREFHLISCFSNQLCLGPVVVRHRPERSILAQFVDSWVSFDEINDGCMHYLDHLAPAGEICVVSGQCALEYMNWFFVISHPFMIAAQPLDPPRDAPATHDASFVEPHIPQVPKPIATSIHARSDEACHAITERLKCLLNLRIVTEGIATHEVMEECIRIARGVTEDCIVDVRSRRRRRTDQP
ncbi:Protein MAIN-LIKE 2 [Glycine soja]